MPLPEGEFVITTSRVLPAKRWQVLRLLAHAEDYLSHVPGVKECRVLSRNRHEAVTSWKVEMDGVLFTWKEKTIPNYRNFMIEFQAVEGDLEKFEGCWKLEDHPFGGTEVFLEAAIKIGIPVLEHVMGGVISEKVRTYFEVVLCSFEEALLTQRYRKIGEKHSKRIGGFGVIGHPYNFQHLIHYFQTLKNTKHIPSQDFLTRIFEIVPSYVSHEIKEFADVSGKKTRGSFIVCNIIPDMLAMDIDKVVRKVVESCKLAEKLGLGVVALGGFTSIAGEKYGEEFRKLINIPVTTGNTLTAALAIEGVMKAARLMGLDLSEAEVTVVGGTGDIGSACAHALTDKVHKITITGRSPENLKKIQKALSIRGGAKICGSLNNNAAVRDADIVIAAASSAQAIVDLSSFKPGAIICDIGYPKNISYAQTDRKDILVFAGGICSLPTEFDAGFDIGLPSSKVLYGCFSEAIVLALEERYENFSWGKWNITKEKMAEILEMARRHGFDLAPFFWGYRQVSDEEVRAIGASRTVRYS
jgi:predicted amino acid dehydrogenase/ribosome-associated toxin RatA of RatAB toxin-antitoxin module